MSDLPKKEFRCSICGKVSTREFNHREHERTHFPPTKQCPYCPKVFKSSSSLAGHIARHNQAGSRVNRLAQSTEATQQQELQADGTKLIWMRPVRLEHAGEVAQVLSEGRSARYSQGASSSSIPDVGPSLLGQPLRSGQPPPRVQQASSHERQRQDDRRGRNVPAPSQSSARPSLRVNPPAPRRRPNEAEQSDREVSPLPEGYNDSNGEIGSDVSDLED